jgi:uncharacterized protein (DUF2147 family)
MAAARLAPLAAVLVVSAVWAGAAQESTPTGLWKTIDDKTGAPRGVVRIYEEKGQFWGRLEATLKPEEAHERCEKCTDERKNQPVVGMVILRRMTRKGDEYSGGDILDPDTGSVYRCKLKITDGDRKLQVRGYLGLSLFGRTQVWIREQ